MSDASTRPNARRLSRAPFGGYFARKIEKHGKNNERGCNDKNIANA